MPKWTDRKGIAAHLTQSLRTVDNLRRRRAIPFVRVGRRVIFDIDAVDLAIKRLEFKSPQ